MRHNYYKQIVLAVILLICISFSSAQVPAQGEQAFKNVSVDFGLALAHSPFVDVAFNYRFTSDNIKDGWGLRYRLGIHHIRTNMDYYEELVRAHGSIGKGTLLSKSSDEDESRFFNFSIGPVREAETNWKWPTKFSVYLLGGISNLVLDAYEPSFILLPVIELLEIELPSQNLYSISFSTGAEIQTQVYKTLFFKTGLDFTISPGFKSSREIGYRINPSQEFEYTRIEDPLSFYNLSINAGFVLKLKKSSWAGNKNKS